jgi:octaprenyl-diphosphate synthase
MADVAEASPKEQLMGAIAPEVAKIEKTMRQDLQEATAGADPLLSEVLDYGIFNGGKRLRPLLVVLAAHLCGLREETERKGEKNIYELAIAFEYLHGATLFHDDVIDRADMRRGKPSVNKEFGTVAAILGGDFLHSRSMFLVGELGGIAALKIFCQATNAMVDGEFLQLRNAQNYNLSEDDYFAAVKGKTALLIAATCEIGALFGGGTASEQRALAEYGISLGSAFQIVDDLLDYQGDAVETGKVVGNDFQEGKMTLPLILALGAANSEDKERLLFLIESESERQDGFSEAYGLIEKYDGFGLSRKRAESIVADAVIGLEIFSGEESQLVLGILNALAQYVLARKK